MHFLFFLPVIFAAQRFEYFFIPFDRLTEASTVYFDAGEEMDPEFRVSLSAAIDLSTSEIILEDSRCGEIRTDCPSYCRDRRLAVFYCGGDCQQLATQNLYAFCLKTFYTEYNSSMTGGQLIRKNWYRRMGIYERWFGDVYVDYFRFWGVSGEYVDFSENSLQIPNLKFVSLLRWSSREFAGEGLLGLAPGGTNFVDQIFEQRRIDHRIVSVGAHCEAAFRKRMRPHRGLMTVGALDKVRCFDWSFHPTNDSWAVVAEEIVVNGSFILTNQLVAFSTSNRISQFPKQVYDFFAAEPCYSSYDIRLKIAEREFPLEGINFYGEHCQRYIVPTGDRAGGSEPVYTSVPQWILGNTFLAAYCIGYDYERDLLALGRNRFPNGPSDYFFG